MSTEATPVATEQTDVKEVMVELDSFFPGAESVVTPTEETKPKIFDNEGIDISFLDKPEEDAEAEPAVSDILDQDIKPQDTAQEDTSQEDGPKPGRPKTEKSALVGFLKKRIESGEMFAFDDYDESKQTLDDYLSNLKEADLDELWSANITHLKQEVASQTPKEFFESLPPQLQYAAKYVMDGGDDLPGLFKALSQVEEVRELDPTRETDQKSIARQYLQATNFGTEQEIEEQIAEWEEFGTLSKKAELFKPKLDKLQEQMVAQKLAQQEEYHRQQQEAAETYVKNVFEALRPGDLGGIKLDKKTQTLLYNGLTTVQYPSVSGQKTNLLGYLLEKYQFTEPNYALIAEATWLLSDPEGYRNSVMQLGENKATEKTVKQLKIEQSRKTHTGVGSEDNDSSKTRKLPRPSGNFFKR